jgi:DNA-binding NtrC family response regulator
MIRILFVDDDPNVLSGLQRMLRPLRQTWSMRFVDGASAALDALACEPYDVIVSDMRMPGMSGAQLLAEVGQRHPHIGRIILSGQSDQEHLQQLAGIPHEYLAKPCDGDQIRDAVTRASLHRSIPNGIGEIS